VREGLSLLFLPSSKKNKRKGGGEIGKKRMVNSQLISDFDTIRGRERGGRKERKRKKKGSVSSLLSATSSPERGRKKRRKKKKRDRRL